MVSNLTELSFCETGSNRCTILPRNNAERAVVKRSTAELQRLQGLIDEKEAVIGQALPRMRDLVQDKSSLMEQVAELEARLAVLES